MDHIDFELWLVHNIPGKRKIFSRVSNKDPMQEVSQRGKFLEDVYRLLWEKFIDEIAYPLYESFKTNDPNLDLLHGVPLSEASTWADGLIMAMPKEMVMRFERSRILNVVARIKRGELPGQLIDYLNPPTHHLDLNAIWKKTQS